MIQTINSWAILIDVNNEVTPPEVNAPRPKAKCKAKAQAKSIEELVVEHVVEPTTIEPVKNENS